MGEGQIHLPKVAYDVPEEPRNERAAVDEFLHFVGVEPAHHHCAVDAYEQMLTTKAVVRASHCHAGSRLRSFRELTEAFEVLGVLRERRALLAHPRADVGAVPLGRRFLCVWLGSRRGPTHNRTVRDSQAQFIILSLRRVRFVCTNLCTAVTVVAPLAASLRLSSALSRAISASASAFSAFAFSFSSRSRSFSACSVQKR